MHLQNYKDVVMLLMEECNVVEIIRNRCVYVGELNKGVTRH